MFLKVRIVLWVLAAIVALVYGYTGKLTYRLDGQNLCIRSDEWLGCRIREQVIPASDIGSVELHRGAGGGRWGFGTCVVIVGKQGEVFRQDSLEIKVENDIEEGLRNALNKQPIGRYEISCVHTKYKGWFFAAGLFLLAVCELYDCCQERKSRRT